MTQKYLIFFTCFKSLPKILHKAIIYIIFILYQLKKTQCLINYLLYSSKTGSLLKEIGYLHCQIYYSPLFAC
jgi:hypothetical protein